MIRVKIRVGIRVRITLRIRVWIRVRIRVWIRVWIRVRVRIRVRIRVRNIVRIRVKVGKICRNFFHRNCNVANTDPFYCNTCLSISIPFNSITDNTLTELYSPTIDEFINELNQNLSNIHNDLPDVLENSDVCSYYDLNSYNDFLPTLPKNDLLIVSINIASLCKNQQKIEQFLSASLTSPSIIAISETKIRLSDNVTNQYNLDNFDYTFEHNDTPSHFGGVGLYIKNNIEYNLRNDIVFNVSRCETLWIEVKDSVGKSSIVGVIYRHPGHNIRDFHNELMRNIDVINSENKPIYICGDINIDLSRYHISQPIKHYVDTLQSLSYRVLIDKPTRITVNSATVIDHFYSNDFVNCIEPGILAADFSDHLATFLHVPSSFNRETEASQTLIRDMKNFNEENFISDLHNSLVENIDLSENDTDVLFCSLDNIFSSTVDKHAPLRQKTNSELKKALTPWITNGIINSIKHKSKLRLRSVKYKTDENILAYNRYRNFTNRIIIKAKRNYYSEKLKRAMNTSRTTWAIINEVIGKKKNKHKKIPKLLSQTDGSTITNPASNSNEFNYYFSNIGKKWQTKYPTNLIVYLVVRQLRPSVYMTPLPLKL